MKLKTNKNLQLRIGSFLLGFIVLLLLFPVLFQEISFEMNLESRLQPSSSLHLLGTDDLGRDLLSCILYGTGISLLIGFTVVLLSASLGTVTGMISGLAGGMTDTIIMRIVDIILAFPGILLAIALVSFLEPGL
jgi:peptide/nickel transport system permease protein